MEGFQLFSEAYLPLIVELFLLFAGMAFVIGGFKIESDHQSGTDSNSGKSRAVLGFIIRIFGYLLIIVMSLLIFLQFAHSSC